MRPPLASYLAPVVIVGTLTTAATAAVAGSDASSTEPGREIQAMDVQFPRGTAQTPQDYEQSPHNFYFTRAAYSGGRGGFGWGRWATDYPTADRWIADVLGRLTGVDVYGGENPVRLDDPEIRRFPFIYVLEVGDMRLRQPEVEGLRDYLLAGGFMVVDDFWGSYEWDNFQREMARVLPEYAIVDVPLDHAIFSTFYEIDEIVQVPNIGAGRRGGPTHERGESGRIPRVRGIFDDSGRLMVIINWNTDLGDAWEHAEDPSYPLQYSTYAYQMAANFIVYSMTR